MLDGGRVVLTLDIIMVAAILIIKSIDVFTGRGHLLPVCYIRASGGRVTVSFSTT